MSIIIMLFMLYAFEVLRSMLHRCARLSLPQSCAHVTLGAVYMYYCCVVLLELLSRMRSRLADILSLRPNPSRPSATLCPRLLTAGGPSGSSPPGVAPGA